MGRRGGQTTPYLLGLAGNQVLVAGDGSTPYTVILTAQQLQAVNDNLAGDYVLGNAIDASGIANFSPIGDDAGTDTAFTGDFNGLGYTIANLTIDDASDTDVGLFGQIGAGGTVENLGLTRENITGSADGADVGGLAGSNSGTIENAYATGTVTGSSAAHVGGLVGINSGTIEDAYATGAVSGPGAVGGLVGDNDDGTIDGRLCHRRGLRQRRCRRGWSGTTTTVPSRTPTPPAAVSGGSGSRCRRAGRDQLRRQIEDAYATGTVTGGSDSAVGGLVGDYDGGTITDADFDTTTTDTTATRRRGRTHAASPA